VEERQITFRRIQKGDKTTEITKQIRARRTEEITGKRKKEQGVEERKGSRR
jgi:hypothetical protein